MEFDPSIPPKSGNPRERIPAEKRPEPGAKRPAPAARPVSPDGRPTASRPAAPGGRPTAAQRPAAPGGRPTAAQRPAASGGRPTAASRPAPSGGRPAAQRPVSPDGRPAAAARPAPRQTPPAARKPAEPGRPPVRKPAPQSQERPGAQVRSGRPAPAPGERRPAPGGERRPPQRRPEASKRPAPHGSAPTKRTSSQNPTGSYSPRFASGGKKSLGIKVPGLNMEPKMLAFVSALILGSLLMLILCIRLVTGPSEPVEYQEIPEIPPLETAVPVIPTLVSEAKFTVTGDLLPHKTIYSKGSAVYQDEQAYDFAPIFKFLGGYTDTADYAIANLETSLFGPDKPYSGNPKFNTPDQIVDGAKNAGFDMLLTANNHCNDTGLPGVLRTVQVIRDRGLKALGTNLDTSEQKYHIQDVGGIRVGMLCYTYEDSQNPDQVTFNYNPLPKDSSDLVCAFPKFQNVKSREPFYEKISQQIQEMRQKGADAVVIFLHWGDEYYLEPNADQKDMAQRLCDLGADLIVGGHPHVVEPVELLTSREDPNHKTVCLYSLGNAFSNQRREEMTSQKSGHTEDGMLFNFTFQKYSDHSVYLSSVEVIPTWVNKHTNPEGKREYNILPLEDSRKDQWQTLFGIDDAVYQKAIESYARTMNIVGAGVEASNSWLSQQLPRQEAPAETTIVPGA